MLALSLALWILQFGFGIGQWYVPTLNAFLWIFYFVRLKKSLVETKEQTEQI
jgi:hypothetical protein